MEIDGKAGSIGFIKADKNQNRINSMIKRLNQFRKVQIKVLPPLVEDRGHYDQKIIIRQSTY